MTTRPLTVQVPENLEYYELEKINFVILIEKSFSFSL